MSVKTIAVVLLSVQEAEWLAPAACELARVHEAHLIGLHAAEPIQLYASMGMEGAVLPELTRMQIETAEQIAEIFNRAAKLSGVANEFRQQDSGFYGAEEFALSSVRSADLVVTGTADPAHNAASVERLRDELVRRSGRPVLVMPKDAPLAVRPDRLLVGWSDTREAARAAHDALTLAAAGAAIDILSVHRSVGPMDAAASSREDMAAALDRLGYRATVLDRDAAAGAAGEALLAAALERDAQLLVTGAFGHSRLYDFVIGAVTTYLMQNATLPVLLAK